MVEPGFDLTRIDPIPHRKTLTLVSEFVISTTQFLNRFSYLCEQKLLDVTRNLQRLEITMSILEAKLESIPGLDGNAPAPPTASTTSAPPPSAPGGDVPDGAETVAVSAEVEEHPPETGGMTMKDDPRLAPYFKMLRVGVHPQQVKMKMEAETGLSGDLLDNPDAPSDYVPAPGGDELGEEEMDDPMDEDSEDDMF